jgi:hypothetical protein
VRLHEWDSKGRARLFCGRVSKLIPPDGADAVQDTTVVQEGNGKPGLSVRTCMADVQCVIPIPYALCDRQLDRGGSNYSFFYTSSSDLDSELDRERDREVDRDRDRDCLLGDSARGPLPLRPLSPSPASH